MGEAGTRLFISRRYAKKIYYRVHVVAIRDAKTQKIYKK